MKNLAVVKCDNRHIARKNDLFSIEYCYTSRIGTGNMSALGRSYLMFFLALIKSGFCRVEAPIAALCDAQFRAFGYTKSTRSAYRALAELERGGFIKRRKFRIKENSKISIIDINRENFEYFLKNKSFLSHKDTHVTNRQTYELTNNPTKLQTSKPVKNISISNYNCKNNTKKQKKRQKVNPVLYTVGCVVRADGLPWSYYFRLRDIIEKRVNPGGLEFARYDNIWPSMSFAERESCARREIIPSLVSMQKGESKKMEDLTSLIGALADKWSNKKRLPELKISHVESEKPKHINSLDSDELEILRNAKKRLQEKK